MQANERITFKEELEGIYALYDKDKPTNAVLRGWWNALSQYSMEVVAVALKYHTTHSRFAPKPFDIVELVTKSDGRPSADEAWAIALSGQDEDATVVWTQEMAKAFLESALPILGTGDKVGARMAFRETYNQAVVVARDLGMPTQWIVSQGNDPALREDTIKQARDVGRLTYEQCDKLLLTKTTDDGKAIAGLITNGNVEKLKTNKDSPVKKRELDKINKLLNKA